MLPRNRLFSRKRNASRRNRVTVPVMSRIVGFFSSLLSCFPIKLASDRVVPFVAENAEDTVDTGCHQQLDSNIVNQSSPLQLPCQQVGGNKRETTEETLWRESFSVSEIPFGVPDGLLEDKKCENSVELCRNPSRIIEPSFASKSSSGVFLSRDSSTNDEDNVSVPKIQLQTCQEEDMSIIDLEDGHEDHDNGIDVSNAESNLSCVLGPEPTTSCEQSESPEFLTRSKIFCAFATSSEDGKLDQEDNDSQGQIQSVRQRLNVTKQWVKSVFNMGNTKIHPQYYDDDVLQENSDQFTETGNGDYECLDDDMSSDEVPYKVPQHILRKLNRRYGKCSSLSTIDEGDRFEVEDSDWEGENESQQDDNE